MDTIKNFIGEKTTYVSLALLISLILTTFTVSRYLTRIEIRLISIETQLKTNSDDRWKSSDMGRWILLYDKEMSHWVEALNNQFPDITIRQFDTPTSSDVQGY